MTTTQRPSRGLRNRVLKGALATFGALDLIPLAVLLLSFYPPFLARLTSHGHPRPMGQVRLACALALAAFGALFLLRHRLDALIDRLNAHVRRTVGAGEAAGPPELTPAIAPTLVGAAFVVALVSVALAITSVPGFQWWIGEDGVIEYGSSLSWLAAAGCAVAALYADRRQFRLKLVVYGCLIALFVLAGGEEISWGQRIFHFHAPAALENVNRQREFNLHDIGSISVKENAFFVFVTVICLVVPWLLSRAPEWRAYLRHLNAPIVDPLVSRVYGVGLVAWVIVGVRFGTLGFSPLSLWGHYTQLDDEIWEFFAAFGCFALAALDLAHRFAAARVERVAPARAAAVEAKG